MNRVTRGERILNKIADTGAISSAGKDFLIAALDPMHDTQLKDLQGWPDVESSSSVVRCVKQSFAISKPVSVTTPTWDCLVFNWPWMNSWDFQSHVTNNNLLTAAAAGQATRGGVQAFGVDAGADFTLDQNMVAAGQITLDPTYSKGSSRVVGLGIEVNNTTSKLNKQGTTTVFRLPQSTNDNSVFGRYGFANSGSTSMTTKVCRRPPANIADAMLIPGSRQWEASEGAYLVCPFVGEENPPQLVEYVQPVYWKSSSFEAVTAPQYTGSGIPTNASELMAPIFAATEGSTFAAMAAPFKIYPVHQAGAFFTGLSAETTLTCTVNIYVESFPSVAEKDILVLATPSAQYDPVALELFSHALSVMPVGVPASFNGFGDWFAEAVSDVAKYAAPIANALGFQNIGNGFKVAGNLAKGYLAGQSPQSKPRKPPVKTVATDKLIRNPKPSTQPKKKNGATRQVASKKK